MKTQLETERLIIRHFREDDWRDLVEIAVSKESDPFAACDYPWPTAPGEVKDVCAYFASDAQFWAVEVKATGKVVCFVNFNGMNEAKELDIGHVMNSAYFGNDYEREALGALYQYGFDQLNASAITASWALADENKLAPLRALGMKVVSTRTADMFSPGADGTTGQFEACTLRVEKDDFGKER